MTEKIMGSILLWHLIINWGGILDARKWVFISEMVRIPVTMIALIMFSDLLDKPFLLALSIVYHLYCLYWTAKYFNIHSAELQVQALN